MLRLKANPTFKAKVEIPTPGGENVSIQFEFRHMTRDEYENFIDLEGEKKRTDEIAMHEVVVGWSESDIDTPFSSEALKELSQQYHGAAYAIVLKYINELTAARTGN